MISFFIEIKNSLCTFLYNLAREFLSYLYKENCIVCGGVLQTSANYKNTCLKPCACLCKTCLKNVEILSGFPHTKFEDVEIYSATIYKDIIRKLIHKLKFNHKKDAASVLACFLFEYYKKIKTYKNECGAPINPENIVIVPIPTNKNNIKQRGYNNVLEIVKEFSALSGIQYSKNLLLKTKNTKPQYKLGLKERQKNVFGCFKLNLKECEKYKGKTVLIIDDIYTTGSTLKEVIKTFNKNNMEIIFCMTLSKAV